MSQFEELMSASVSYLGVSSCGPLSQFSMAAPNLKELDLTGNLLSEWTDVGAICKGLPALRALNLSNNFMSQDITAMPLLKNIRVLVLSNTGIKWLQGEMLKDSLSVIEELRLMGNNIREIMLSASATVQGFDSLRLLNLEDNWLSDWNEILKLSQLKRYVCLVMLELHDNPEEIKQLHPSYTSKSFSVYSFAFVNRFTELKEFHGTEKWLSVGAAGPQKMASGLISISLKCVGASIGEKRPLTKKFPATTMVGKLKILCESFFNLKSVKPIFFLHEEVSPLPTLLDDDMACLIDLGVGNGSTILIDE